MGKYKKLVAFSVMEEDENTGDIYFAKSDIEARKRGADEFADGEISYVTCRRAQWADKFAPGPVPFSAKFEQGWWVECSGCGVTIQEGGYDSKGNEIDFEIVEVGDAVYCTPACRERRLADDAKVDAVKKATIAELTARLLQIIPGAAVSAEGHVYVPRGTLVAKEGCVYFTFPGTQHGSASYRFSEIGEVPTVMVPFGDVAAFQTWREAGYPAATEAI